MMNMFVRPRCLRGLLFSFLALVAHIGACDALAVVIRISPEASDVEKTAAEELRHYILELTGQTATIISHEPKSSQSEVFHIRLNPEMPAEKWSFRSVADGVMLEGGRRGVLYAVYHYLEDICGVQWYTHDAQFVPPLAELPIRPLRLEGEPEMPVRDIPFTRYRDEEEDGKLAARLRINAIGSRRIPDKWGGSERFGSPRHCHTFRLYIPYSRYGKTHPEWFAMRDGKRFDRGGDSTQIAQLCLSNSELRQEVVKRLIEFIEKDRADAGRRGVAPPVVYDISQDDNQRYCQCDECNKIVMREGGRQSGIMIDFINEIADAISEDYPDILISTFAYQYTEEPPSHIQPRPNVLIVLCDTKGNLAAPISDRSNAKFRRLLEEWSVRATQLRVWDYAGTWQAQPNLPVASEYFIADDIKTLRQYNVSQYYPQLSIHNMPTDVGVYKRFLFARLMENPNLDFDMLSRDFADGYFGPAGGKFLEYRNLLLESMQRSKPFIAMYPPGAGAYVHLDLDTVLQAQRLFDEGAEYLGSAEILLARWRHARLSLDRAALNLERPLMREHVMRGGTIEDYPLDRNELLERVRQTWSEHLHTCYGQYIETEAARKGYQKRIDEMNDELARIRDFPPTLAELTVPARIADVDPSRVFDFSAWDVRPVSAIDLLKDPDTETGIAARIYHSPESEPIDDSFSLPGTYEVFSYERWGGISGGSLGLSAQGVQSDGYHWYKVGTTRVTPGTCLILWNWRTRLALGRAFDDGDPDASYDIWLRLKFTGPGYPHGKPDEDNAIYLERVTLVRQGG